MVIKSDMQAIMQHIKEKSDDELFQLIAESLHEVLAPHDVEDSKYHDLDVMLCSSDHIDAGAVERLKAKLPEITPDLVDFLYIVGLNGQGEGVEVVSVLALFGKDDQYVDVRILEPGA